MNTKTWIKNNTKSLSGKTVAITGATGGLGKQLCLHLAFLGAKLLLLNRSIEKTEKLKVEILEEYPNANIEFVRLDMLNQKSIDEAISKLGDFQIDIFVLNAGAFNLPRKKSEHNFDITFQTNFVSQYYITKKMLKQFETQKTKVVMVGSIAYRYAKLNEKDIDYSKIKDKQEVYGNSKRFLMFSLLELLKKEKIKFSIGHPGITQTNITSNYPKWFRAIANVGMKIVYMSPKKASLSIIKAIFDDSGYAEWWGPRFSNIWGFPKKKILDKFDNCEAKKMFEIAEKIYVDIANR